MSQTFSQPGVLGLNAWLDCADIVVLKQSQGVTMSTQITSGHLIDIQGWTSMPTSVSCGTDDNVVHTLVLFICCLFGVCVCALKYWLENTVD